MASVHVAESAQLLVVATRECGATAHSARNPHDFEIQSACQFGHGIGFVYFFGGEQLFSRGAEERPGSLADGLVLLAFAGDVKKAEQETIGANAGKTVEVSTHAPGKVSHGGVRTLQRRAVLLNDLGCFHDGPANPKPCQQPHSGATLAQSDGWINRHQRPTEAHLRRRIYPSANAPCRREADGSRRG